MFSAHGALLLPAAPRSLPHRRILPASPRLFTLTDKLLGRLEEASFTGASDDYRKN
jgi:hypothetical protein